MQGYGALQLFHLRQQELEEQARHEALVRAATRARRRDRSAWPRNTVHHYPAARQARARAWAWRLAGRS